MYKTGEKSRRVTRVSMHEKEGMQLAKHPVSHDLGLISAEVVMGAGATPAPRYTVSIRY